MNRVHSFQFHSSSALSSHSTCSDVSHHSRGKKKKINSDAALILVATPLGFLLSHPGKPRRSKLSLLSSLSRRVFPSWHLVVHLFPGLLRRRSPLLLTVRPVCLQVSCHRRETHSYSPSKMTSDLLAGMLCRRKGSAAIRTPPAGAFTIVCRRELCHRAPLWQGRPLTH